MLLLREGVASTSWLAAGLMGLGVWLHLTEKHEPLSVLRASDGQMVSQLDWNRPSPVFK